MAETLENRVLLAKTEPSELSRLLTEYSPFILSGVLSVCSEADDDFVQAGMIAFAQAVKVYDSEKGNFLALAKTVIKRRVTDLLRASKGGRELTVLDSDEEESAEVINLASRRVYEMNTEAAERREEIDALVAELSKWSITLSQLSDSSPRHAATREACKAAISLLLHDGDLFNDFFVKRKLPVSAISQRLKIKKKLLEDHRRYIVAAVLIHSGDYPYIKEYIKLD